MRSTCLKLLPSPQGVLSGNLKIISFSSAFVIMAFSGVHLAMVNLVVLVSVYGIMTELYTNSKDITYVISVA